MLSKISKFKRFLLPIVSVFILSSCASALNPYHSNFQCPLDKLNEGKCESIPSAYHDALNANSTKFELETMSTYTDSNNNPLKEQYQNSLYQKATNLLQKPQTPIVLPPKVMRIYFLPYESNGQLFMGQYTYILVGKPRWVFSVNQEQQTNSDSSGVQ